jgi:uncharacterized protein (DUF2267 family)
MNHSTFFREVADRIECDTVRAEALSLAVFEELRDRLTVREVEQAEAQMDSHLKSIPTRRSRNGRTRASSLQLGVPNWLRHARTSL